jgi:hypothetical protein
MNPWYEWSVAERRAAAVEALQELAVDGYIPTYAEWRQWKPHYMPTMNWLLKHCELAGIAELAELAGLQHGAGRVSASDVIMAMEWQPQWNYWQAGLECIEREVVEVDRFYCAERNAMMRTIRTYWEVR